MATKSGVRIRLDLSSFQTETKKRFRWAYLPYDNFSQIKDVKNHIKTNFLPESKTSQKIRLYLQEPFWQRAGKLSVALATDTSPTFCWLPASESVRILMDGDLVVARPRDELAEETLNEIRNQKAGQDKRTVELHSVGSQMNMTREKNISKEVALKKVTLSSSEVSSDDSLEEIPAKKSHLESIKKRKPSSDESSETESSCEDEQESKKEKGKTKTSEQMPEIQTLKLNAENLDGKKSKKRKRKRKPKNKNRLPIVENATLEPIKADPLVNPQISPAISAQVRVNPVTKKARSNQSTKHKFFPDDDMDTSQNETATEEYSQNHIASPAKMLRQHLVSESHSPDVRAVSSLSLLQSQHEQCGSSEIRQPDVLSQNGVASGLTNGNVRVGEQKPRLVANSAEISCEEAMLGQVHSLKPGPYKNVKPNGILASLRLPNGHHTNNSPRENLLNQQNSRKVTVAVPPVGNEFGNLLGLAQTGSMLRGFRKRRNDVYTHMSVVLENTSAPGDDKAVEHLDRTKCHPYGNILKYPLLNEPPAENSVIAFKILEISANYTPEVSKYFGGKVLSSGLDSIQVLITFDENVDNEPRNRKFEVDEEVESVSKVGQELTLRWIDLIEARSLSN